MHIFQTDFQKTKKNLNSKNLSSNSSFPPINKEDILWTRNHRELLKQQYEGQWIAVYKKKVITNNQDGQKVKETAQKELGEEFKNAFLCFLEPSNAIYSL